VGKPIGEQVVVITGASQGIGRETALQMARRGASVVLAARNTEAGSLSR
jgi:NAD(P)-dependent dehydrogenase (short-subunit alcohol dehydrogenase family)